MDRLRQAVELYERDGFRAPLEPLVEAARSVLDAPRIWWCESYKLGALTVPYQCYRSLDRSSHTKCGWRGLVDDPQEGGEE